MNKLDDLLNKLYVCAYLEGKYANPENQLSFSLEKEEVVQDIRELYLPKYKRSNLKLDLHVFNDPAAFKEFHVQ